MNKEVPKRGRFLALTKLCMILRTLDLRRVRLAEVSAAPLICPNVSRMGAFLSSAAPPTAPDGHGDLDVKNDV